MGDALALNALDTGVSVRALLSDADPAGTIFKQKAHFEKKQETVRLEPSRDRHIQGKTRPEILDTTWRAKHSLRVQTPNSG